MHRFATALFVAAAIALPAALGHAQSTCPSSNRLGFHPQGGSPLDLSSGAFRIYIGTGPTRGGGAPTLQAIVMRGDGSCVGGFYVGVGGAEQRLSRNSNICLGNSDDRVEIITQRRGIACGAGNPLQNLDPFDYGGFSLSIYGGGGNDALYGGNGRDILYGGIGNDSLVGLTGTSDQAFGENGNDTIFGSSGTATQNNGGADTDTIVDRQGFGDALEGGSGNDALDSGCNVSGISCGTGTDQIWHPDPRPWWLAATCETWNDLSC